MILLFRPSRKTPFDGERARRHSSESTDSCDVKTADDPRQHTSIENGRQALNPDRPVTSMAGFQV
jgi:hypothetical protein